MKRFFTERSNLAVCLLALASVTVAQFSSPAAAQAPAQSQAASQLPDGPGKALIVKDCSLCHEPNRVATAHFDEEGWRGEMTKMMSLGAKVSNEDFGTILDYVTTNFPPPVSPIDANSASGVELEIALQIPHKQAMMVVQYRDQHGKFNSITDVEKIPGVDVKKIEANKDRVSF